MIRTHCEKGNAIQLIFLKILAIKFSKISTISPAIKGWWIGEAWGILRAHQTTLSKNPLPKYTGRGGGCVRVSLRLPLSTTHQIVREMYDFTQKEIGYISGSMCWIFFLFSASVVNITLHHLLNFQKNLANSLTRAIY